MGVREHPHLITAYCSIAINKANAIINLSTAIISRINLDNITLEFNG